jgi:hypothetical protein
MATDTDHARAFLDDFRRRGEVFGEYSAPDVNRLLAAAEAVLAKADSWQRFAVPGDVGYDDAQAFREAITTALLGEGDDDV